MSKQTACPEQCRDCKWHVRITGLVRGGLHRCMYEMLWFLTFVVVGLCRYL